MLSWEKMIQKDVSVSREKEALRQGRWSVSKSPKNGRRLHKICSPQMFPKDRLFDYIRNRVSMLWANNTGKKEGSIADLLPMSQPWSECPETM